MRVKPIVLLVGGLLIGSVLVGAVAVLSESFWVTAGVTAAVFLGLGVLVRRQPAEPPAGPAVSYRPLADSARPAFPVVLRGYDRAHVDRLVALIETTRHTDDRALRASVAADVRSAAFLIVLRGYDRGEVDTWLRAAAAELNA